MNVASLENCKKLFELSGWKDTSLKSWEHDNHPEENMGDFVGQDGSTSSISWVCPAYDAGFLLRRLPNYIDTEDEAYELQLWHAYDDCWTSSYKLSDPELTIHSDTPEDALALLAIKLFEEGVLK